MSNQFLVGPITSRIQLDGREFLVRVAHGDHKQCGS